MERRAGSDDGFGALLAEQISQHGRLFFKLAHGVLREPAAAEDVCQQTFLRAWEQRRHIRDPLTLRAWLAKVIVTESLQAVRRRSAEQRAMVDRATHASEPALRPAGSGEMRDAVLMALTELPDAMRLVVAMRIMQGLSGNEVKDLLGCSAAEVSRQLHQGMERLRELFDGLAGDVTMSCDLIRQLLLDFGWDQADRHRAGQVLRHLESCEACRTAARDYDALRGVLRAGEAEPMPDGGWAGFEQRMVPAANSMSHRLSMRIVPRIAALAAAVLLGIGVAQLWSHWLAPPRMPPLIASSPPEHFTGDQIAQNVQAFEQVSQVFDRKTSWLLVSNGESKLGLASELASAQRSVLLLRLTMRRSGTVASVSDLVIVPGQTANLTVPLGQAQSLRYQIGTVHRRTDASEDLGGNPHPPRRRSPRGPWRRIFRCARVRTSARANW